MQRPQKVTIRHLPTSFTAQQLAELLGDHAAKQIAYVDLLHVRKRTAHGAAVVLHFNSSHAAEQFHRTALLRLPVSSDVVYAPCQRVLASSDLAAEDDAKENTYREDELWLSFTDSLRAAETAVPTRGHFLLKPPAEPPKLQKKLPEISPLVNELVLRHASRHQQRVVSRRRKQPPAKHNETAAHRETTAKAAALVKEKRRRKRGSAKTRRSHQPPQNEAEESAKNSNSSPPPTTILKRPDAGKAAAAKSVSKKNYCGGAKKRRSGT